MRTNGDGPNDERNKACRPEVEERQPEWRQELAPKQVQTAGGNGDI